MFTIAAAFGNVHGVYKPGNVKLQPELLNSFQQNLASIVGYPKPFFFVFHGGSGSSQEGLPELGVPRCPLRRSWSAGLPAPPPKLKKPKFTKVEKITPDGKGLNLMLKSIKCEEKEDKSGWIAVLGDESGIVKFSLKSAEMAALCKAGSSVRVQNAKVLMLVASVLMVAGPSSSSALVRRHWQQRSQSVGARCTLFRILTPRRNSV